MCCCSTQAVCQTSLCRKCMFAFFIFVRACLCAAAERVVLCLSHTILVSFCYPALFWVVAAETGSGRRWGPGAHEVRFLFHARNHQHAHMQCCSTAGRLMLPCTVILGLCTGGVRLRVFRPPRAHEAALPALFVYLIIYTRYLCICDAWPRKTLSWIELLLVKRQ